MLKLLRDYLRLILFLGGALAGIQVPGFVDQYGKSLQSHALEAKQQMSGFQQDADRYFAGNLQQLIDHYSNNQDPVVNAGGNNIRDMVLRYRQLDDALQRFNASLYSPYRELLLHPLSDIRAEVWQHYSHNVLLKQDAIAFALLSGLLLALLGETLLGLLWLLFIRPFSRRTA